MKIPKRLAIFGFNLCASIFIGLCVYGLLVYIEGDRPRQFSTSVWGLFAVGVIACIVGICFFGAQWDMRNAEEARKAGPAGGPNPKQRT